MAIVTVIGATGRQGLAQIRQLLKAGHEPRAVSRRKDPFLGTEYAKVEIIQADLQDDESMAAAMRGADFVFHTQPYLESTDRALTMDRLGSLAKQEGIKRLVWNTSSWIPERKGEAGPYAKNTTAVNALFRTGAPATVLAPVIFMDNLLTDWARPFIINEKRYVYPHHPKLAANWICLDDVARCMIAVMDRPDMEGSWLNIGGPEKILPHQVAEILSDVLGETIRYDPCTPAEFGEYLVRAFGDNIQSEHADLYKQFTTDFYAFTNQTTLRPFEVDIDFQFNRIPLKLQTLSEWAKTQDWQGTEQTLRAPAG